MFLQVSNTGKDDRTHINVLSFTVKTLVWLPCTPFFYWTHKCQTVLYSDPLKNFTQTGRLMWKVKILCPWVKCSFHFQWFSWNSQSLIKSLWTSPVKNFIQSRQNKIRWMVQFQILGHGQANGSDLHTWYCLFCKEHLNVTCTWILSNLLSITF